MFVFSSQALELNEQKHFDWTIFVLVQIILHGLQISDLFVFRYVPYVGIVTILMNDYPKFKVSLLLMRSTLF